MPSVLSKNNGMASRCLIAQIKQNSMRLEKRIALAQL
jgi:hypothetical protein